ncbi:MAG: DnaD domain protein [Clostridiales bacterium]|nr:DnaD domain protein [Clostridiales bacterium]
MQLCSFDDNYKIFDITPIENLFIQEFMLRAPGNFVKVYIYGLSLCYDRQPLDIENFARSLDLDANEVQNAFRYWERQGILELDDNGDTISSVKYYNIKDVIYNKDYNIENTLYKYKDFNQNLQLMFGSRLLTPQEYIKIYDWIEILRLPKEVILMMIQFYLAEKGPNLSINYLDKVAIQWAKDGIDTMHKAEDYIQASESCYKETVAVLKYLGIHRSPSKIELELYKKWREGWGFSLNAILQACRETAKAQSPSFAYLDKILENLHRQKLITPQQILNHQDSRGSIQKLVREVLYNLGLGNTTVTPKHQELYNKWTQDWKFDHSVILMACKECVRNKSNTFEALDSSLHRWLKRGLRTAGDIRKYIDRVEALDIDIRAVLDRAGDNRLPTPADRKLFIKWTETWNMSYELILLAAEYSIAARNKMPFIHRILESWNKNNIRSLREAREDHKRHRSRQGRAPEGPLSKQVDFNKFEQHEYTDDELESLFEDIENL